MIDEVKKLLSGKQAKKFANLILIGGGIFLIATLIEKYYNVISLIRQAKLNKYQIEEYEKK